MHLPGLKISKNTSAKLAGQTLLRRLHRLQRTLQLSGDAGAKYGRHLCDFGNRDVSGSQTMARRLQRLQRDATLGAGAGK